MEMQKSIIQMVNSNLKVYMLTEKELEMEKSFMIMK